MMNFTKEKSSETLINLDVAMQYSPCVGLEPLVQFCKDFVQLIAKPKYCDWDLMFTCGNTEGLAKVVELIFTRRDKVLVEEFTYPTALETFAPKGVESVPIGMDGEGMRPEALDEKLKDWDVEAQGSKPRVVYLVPCGQNPTGSTHSPERRMQIYRVAQKHDLIIIEDDPYYFLQMEPYNPKNANSDSAPSHEAFLNSLVPPYLSYDTDGRVIRLESFSKILAPGLRMGWVVANKNFIERILRITELTSVSPAGLSQAVVAQLLLGPNGWKMSGWIDWLIYIRRQYTLQRNILLTYLDKLLSKGYYSYTPPSAGMFVWVQINLRNNSRSVVEQIDEIFEIAVRRKLLILPGKLFATGEESLLKSNFIRLTFATADEESCKTAIERLDAIFEEFFNTGN